MKKIITSKESCIEGTIVTEFPLNNLNTWNRFNEFTQYVSDRDCTNLNITAKEEIKYVYDVIYNPEYDIFKVEKAYSPKEISIFIEDFYSELPDKRVVKFIVTNTPMEQHYVYYCDGNYVIGAFDRLIDIAETKMDLTDKFIYVVDVSHNVFRVNEECEGMKEKLMDIMNEE